MKPNRKNFNKEKLITCLIIMISIFMISQTVNATTATGKFYIHNQTGCSLVLDHNQQNQFASAQFEMNKILKNSKSGWIYYTFDTSAYADLKIDANASCKLKGNGTASYWTIIVTGGAKGRFNSEAACRAAIDAHGIASLGITPTAFISIPGYTIGKKGNKKETFDILLSRTSNNSITISSNFHNPQSCGTGNGLFTFNPPKTLIASTLQSFDNYTENAKQLTDQDKIYKIIMGEIEKSQLAGIPPIKVKISGQHYYLEPKFSFNKASISIDKQTYSFKIGINVTIKNLTSYSTSNINWEEEVKVKNFSDFSKLNLCFIGGNVKSKSSYVIYPTVQNPEQPKCRSNEWK